LIADDDNARLEALAQVAGEPGQIAIHGIANLTGKTGTASSHGCVRLSAQDIGWLASRTPLGMRVSIGA
jgi:lipoprotein-anchoring transpeptidase ErfK/SrfK